MNPSIADQLRHALASLFALKGKRRPQREQLPSDLPKMMAELSQLLGKLEQQGMSPLYPLGPNIPNQPIYVKAPITMDVVNVPPQALAGELNVVPDGQLNSRITILPLLKQR